VKTPTLRLVIIGGGPAGVEAARTAAPHATVTLVSAEAPGLWRPLASRVWLAAAAAGERSTRAIAERAARAVAAWQEQCTTLLAGLEVQMLAGRARLAGPGQVVVEPPDGAPEQRLAADAVIIATGAATVFPPGLEPNHVRILADTELGTLEETPRRALVIGDGTSGFELCHILNLLGAEVTWLVPEEAPRTRLAPEVDGYLTRMLERQGVVVAPEASVQQLVAGEREVMAITADGERRLADVAMVVSSYRSDPEAIGLPADQATVDVYGQTRWRGVYLVGDALEPCAASVAMAQGRAAAQHALRRSSGPADTRHIVLTFMERPQVAKLGRLTTEGAYGSVTAALTEGLAAHIHETPEGFLTLAWDQAGRIAGALAVAPTAADMLAPVAIAMRMGMRLEDLASSYGPHPSLSELAALAARKMDR